MAAWRGGIGGGPGAHRGRPTGGGRGGNGGGLSGAPTAGAAARSTLKGRHVDARWAGSYQGKEPLSLSGGARYGPGLRGCGGTGRRAGFRFQCRKAWRFESSHPHQIPCATAFGYLSAGVVRGQSSRFPLSPLTARGAFEGAGEGRSLDVALCCAVASVHPLMRRTRDLGRGVYLLRLSCKERRRSFSDQRVG